jgi:hypothetical protein
MNNFVILSESRTGGTHVVAMLNSHPKIKCVSEPFAHHNLKISDAQISWSNNFFSDSENGKACGFRTKVHQIDNITSFFDMVKLNKLHIIYLERKNLVKRAISRIRGTMLYKVEGDYNVKKSKKLNPLGKTIIPVKKLLMEIKQCESEIENSEKLVDSHSDLPVLKVYYEDLLINERQFFMILQEKLDVEYYDLVTNVRKNTADNLEESVENMEEIESFLSNTPYYGMLLN